VTNKPDEPLLTGVFYFLQCLLRPFPRGSRSDAGSQLQVAGETFLDFRLIPTNDYLPLSVRATAERERIAATGMLKRVF